jgi:hypothetical protein
VDVLAAVEDFLAGPGHVPSRETAMAERAHSAKPGDQDRGGQQRTELSSAAPLPSRVPGGDPADYIVGLRVLEDDAGVLFGQS